MKTKKIFIIAEAGVNHNGNIKIAKKLIREASKSGVDAIKFQTFQASNLATKNAKKAKYQISKLDKDKKQYQMLKELELTKKMHFECIKECKKNNILFMSSAFDIKSFDFLLKLDLNIYKIPSGEITNLLLLKSIGQSKKKIILSTGMSDINEVKNALNVLMNSGTKKINITVLHTNTEYPTPMSDVNLRAMVAMGKELNINYGYSDHTLGIEVGIAAVAMGATCIEKHFTLDSKMRGPDHKASLEPTQLKGMVNAIRNIEKAMGSKIKKPSKSELPNIRMVRKSIVAKTKINKGEILDENNITIKRPGGGISPMKWDKVLGSKAKKKYNEDELI